MSQRERYANRASSEDSPRQTYITHEHATTRCWISPAFLDNLELEKPLHKGHCTTLTTTTVWKLQINRPQELDFLLTLLGGG